VPELVLHNETKVGLLYALKDFTEWAIADIRLPVKRQPRDEAEPKDAVPKVHMMRLPDMTSFEKKAPFILHQVVTSEDGYGNINKNMRRQNIQEMQSSCVIRTVFCIYHPDGEQGGLALLNLMERLRTALLLFPVLDKTFEVDLGEGINQLAHTDNGDRGTAPYYIGEMVTTWKLPVLKRLDAARVAHSLPPYDPKARRYTEIVGEKGL